MNGDIARGLLVGLCVLNSADVHDVLQDMQDPYLTLYFWNWYDDYDYNQGCILSLDFCQRFPKESLSHCWKVFLGTPNGLHVLVLWKLNWSTIWVGNAMPGDSVWWKTSRSLGWDIPWFFPESKVTLVILFLFELALTITTGIELQRSGLLARCEVAGMTWVFGHISGRVDVKTLDQSTWRVWKVREEFGCLSFSLTRKRVATDRLGLIFLNAFEWFFYVRYWMVIPILFTCQANWGGFLGGMFTFLGLAHMVDATYSMGISLDVDVLWSCTRFEVSVRMLQTYRFSETLASKRILQDQRVIFTYFYHRPSPDAQNDFWKNGLGLVQDYLFTYLTFPLQDTNNS